MARYSTVLLPYSFYGNSSLKYSEYGSGDLPDLRLRYLTILPTDSAGSHLDEQGNAVYGRVTLFWDTYANVSSDIKILRSTYGPAVVHNDSFCSVIAATKQSFDIAATTVRYDDGFTVINTGVPHLLNVGDTVVIAGTSNGSVDGTWKISSVLNPAQFAFNHPVRKQSTSTGGTVSISVGRTTLPMLLPGEKTFTDETVVPGNEYHYSIFIEDPTTGITEWHYAGSASIRVPKNFSSFQRLISILPPYLTNKRFSLGGTATVDTMPDTDYDLSVGEPSLTKVLAGMGWVWDDLRTDLEAASRLWEPQLIPSKALPAALETLGITNSISLNNRSLRTTLANASTINELRGSERGLITFSECVTGFSADVSLGYNIMPSVDDAEFYGGIGHWVASPAAVDNSTSSGRSLTTFTPETTGVSAITGGDSVSGVAFIAPESSANGDKATTAINALAMAPGASENASVHLGFGVSVCGVSPSVYTSSRTYTLETAFPHGLEVGDVVTMTSVFPYDNRSTSSDGTTRFPAMVVTATPTATSVSVYLESDIPSDKYSEFFGSTFYNLLGAVPGRKNPFAVANGIPISENSTYTISYEGTMSATPSVGQVSPTTEVSFWDSSGTYVGKFVQGNSAQATYDAAAIAYEDPTTLYNSPSSNNYVARTWYKNVASFTTPTRAAYVAVRAIPVASDPALTHYFRRFMITPGEYTYTYQSPNLVSVNLYSPPSSTTWGPGRTNLMLTPGMAEITAVATSGKSSGTTRTITTSATHSFFPGQNVNIAFGDANYDGLYQIVSTPTSTSFTYVGPTSTSSNATLTTSTITARTLSAVSPNTAAVNTTASNARIGTNSYQLTAGTSSVGIASIAVSDGTVTVTTSSAHGLAVGRSVAILNATASANNVNAVVASVVSSTAFTINNSAGVAQAGAAGTVNYATNPALGSAYVAVPRAGSYTASAYFKGGNLAANGTAVRLVLDKYTNGYESYEYAPSYTTSPLVNPAASPVAYCTGPEDTGTVTSASWLSDKTEWYDEQPTLEVILANHPTDRENNVLGYRSGAYFPRTSESGNAGRVTVSSGGTYRAGAWVRFPDVSANVGASIRWYNSAGILVEETLSSGTTALFSSTNRRDFVWVSTTATAPASATAAVLAIYVDGLTEDLCGASMYVTCPSLLPADAPEVTAFQSAVTNRVNLVYNSSLESSDTSRWGGSGTGMTLLRVNSDAYIGTWSYEVTKGTTGSSGVYATVSPAKGLTTYTSSVYVKVPVSDSETTKFVVTHLYYNRSTAIGSDSGQEVTLSPGSSWVRISVTSTTPANCTGFLIIVSNTETSPTSGKKFLADAWQTLEGTEIAPYEAAGYERAYVTFRVPDTGLVPKITARAMGTSPSVVTTSGASISGASYFSDCWMVESGNVLMSFFDGGSDFVYAPYYAQWNGTTSTSTSTTGKGLPKSAVVDNTTAHVTSALQYLKTEIPNNIAIGIPYRVTFNGQLDDLTPVTDVDPSFTQTYVSSLY